MFSPVGSLPCLDGAASDESSSNSLARPPGDPGGRCTASAAAVIAQIAPLPLWKKICFFCGRAAPLSVLAMHAHLGPSAYKERHCVVHCISQTLGTSTQQQINATLEPVSHQEEFPGLGLQKGGSMEEAPEAPGVSREGAPWGPEGGSREGKHACEEETGHALRLHVFRVDA